MAAWLALLIGSLLLPGSPLRGPQQPKIAVEVKVVNVLAIVQAEMDITGRNSRPRVVPNEKG